MKTLYLDCSMGAAGDMLTAALWELHPQPEDFLRRFNALGLPGVEMLAEKTAKCGITGTHMRVVVNGQEERSCDVAEHTHEHAHEHTHEHAHEHVQEHDHEHTHEHTHEHRNMADIEALLQAMPLSESVKTNAQAVYRLIAQAESQVHGTSPQLVHFHELGALDAVADITAVCMLMEELAPDRVVASPINTGFGQVRCQHGIVPVPAPATAELLKGLPVYGGSIRGELCTPTGAALLRHFAQEFASQPLMVIDAIGYGCGQKEFAAANCLRAFWGHSQNDISDKVVLLSCNIDDMSAEYLAFAIEELMAGGALDAFAQPIVMKRGRPAHMLTCIVKPDDEQKITSLVFKHTTTLGVRRSICERYLLERSSHTVEGELGSVRFKTSQGWGVKRSKAEFSDLAAVALRQGLSLFEVSQAFQPEE